MILGYKRSSTATSSTLEETKKHLDGETAIKTPPPREPLSRR